VDPARIVLELTEREAVEDFQRLRLRLETIRRTGVRIAADDVGAGNAGLRLLSQVRFDIVKIDLSLVQDGALRTSSLAVLRSLRDLAQGSNAVTVAEGVETAEQLRLVQEVGIPVAQGYLLGRPAPTLDFSDIDIPALRHDGEFAAALAAR
jgi:EAL domain-containing protein (putative c-di-GMP-specific phosphodiesterase class I)